MANYKEFDQSHLIIALNRVVESADHAETVYYREIMDIPEDSEIEKLDLFHEMEKSLNQAINHAVRAKEVLNALTDDLLFDRQTIAGKLNPPYDYGPNLNRWEEKIRGISEV